MPSTSTVSRFAVPSTSKSPFASIFPVNVDIPLTKSLAEVVTPETTRSPNTVAPIPVVSNFSAAL